MDLNSAGPFVRSSWAPDPGLLDGPKSNCLEGPIGGLYGEPYWRALLEGPIGGPHWRPLLELAVLLCLDQGKSLTVGRSIQIFSCVFFLAPSDEGHHPLSCDVIVIMMTL